MMPSRHLLLGVLSLAVAAMPAFGQSRTRPNDGAVLQEQEQQLPQLQPQDTHTPPGEVAKSAVGRAGERQTREQAAPNVHPMGRISNRIENRVQSRIRNRIDRDYDPQADANSPFAVAEEKARTTNR